MGRIFAAVLKDGIDVVKSQRRLQLHDAMIRANLQMGVTCNRNDNM